MNEISKQNAWKLLQMHKMNHVMSNSPKKSRDKRKRVLDELVEELDSALLSEDEGDDNNNAMEDEAGWLPVGNESDVEDNMFDPLAEESESSGAETSDESENEEVQGEQKQDDIEVAPIDENMVKRSKRAGLELKKYVRNAYTNYLPLSSKEKCAIRLMHKLIKKRATLDTYEDVMRWHLQESNRLGRYESLGKSKQYVSRDKMMQKLRKRYLMDKKYATSTRITLPHAQTDVVVWKKQARDNILSLLIDPRWKDEDWLFFGGNPFGRPPNNHPFVEDMNTGEAYMKTHDKLITKDNQILVPIPLYIDGAVTGQFDKLQVTSLQMSLGILNRKARDKEYAWRSLGFVSNYTEGASLGKKMFVQSGHVAAFDLYDDGVSDDDDENLARGDPDADKAEDYHAILAVLLKSLRDVIEEGMIIDLQYKGQLFKNCELVFYIPFVKCDGDEGDKLCASYRSRGANVQQLCRYCQCPNASTDDVNAKFAFKTEPMMKHLYETNNVERLKELSQICMKNAFHGLRFGLHNDRGIHGACPWELLHAILLGVFKYVKECWFQQMGPKSATATRINGLAIEYGILFARQSDRKKPRTKFGKGILKGKLMAKEYTGVLLLIVVILRSAKGRDILQTAYKRNFREDDIILDWILLVETMLQWEAYLCQPQMEKAHVRRLKRKHKFVMFLLKKVGNRTTGMGFKVMKFHAILHLAYDIMMFGVPMVVDTGSNESHHKTTKVAAKLTQKDIKTFEQQTSNRKDDFHVLDLAMEEIDGRPLWQYFSGFEHDEDPEPEESFQTGGMILNIFKDEDTDSIEYYVVTRMKNKDCLLLDVQFMNFVYQIQEDVEDFIPKMPICAEHSRNGVIFRAHPNYRGKGMWRDWVMIQWSDKPYPAQIWGFLDLTSLPQGVQVDLKNKTGGVDSVERGVYAVVESCDFVVEEKPESDIFTPLKLETYGGLDNRKFYVVDTETFKEPICVVPNIGCADGLEFLMMTPREQWAGDFVKWIESPHDIDEAEMAEPLIDDSDSSS